MAKGKTGKKPKVTQKDRVIRFLTSGKNGVEKSISKVSASSLLGIDEKAASTLLAKMTNDDILARVRNVKGRFILSGRYAKPNPSVITSEKKIPLKINDQMVKLFEGGSNPVIKIGDKAMRLTHEQATEMARKIRTSGWASRTVNNYIIECWNAGGKFAIEPASTENGKLENDPVNKPKHYTDTKIEVIDYIEDKVFGFHLGQVVKYVSRAGKKDPAKAIEDLEKAEWYLKRQIANLKSGKSSL